MKPLTVVADSAYGYGSHRQAFTTDGISLVAPLQQISYSYGLVSE
ncbi:MAG: hypothetical protein WDZ91_07290 [Paenibacillaceae bacterium]